MRVLGKTVLTGSIDFNFRFPGQYYDTESGLHYNYFRTYDPELGRYLTSDPIGLVGGMNTYTYVENDPVNYIDPLGLLKVSGGFGGSIQNNGAGFSFDIQGGFDDKGNVCYTTTVCGRVGPGSSAGVTGGVSLGEGQFCEGKSKSGGVFAEGGNGGLFGGGSLNVDTNGDFTGSGTLKGGLGGGASAGAQACKTTTVCL